MRADLYLSISGLLAVSEDGEIISKPFSNAPEKILRLQRGEAVNELEELVKELNGMGVHEIRCVGKRLAEVLRGMNYEVKVSSVEGVKRVDELLIKAGLVSNSTEYYARLREIALELAERKVKQAVAKRDLMIVQAVKLLDDLEKQINMLYGRLTEWYSIHFPELRDVIKDPEKYAKFVYLVGSRNRLSEGLARRAGIDNPSRIMELAGESLGIDVAEVDEDKIRKLSWFMLEAIAMKEDVQNYIKSLMEIEAPNVAAIAGPTLGARLISLAGGLEELAKAPASTIQVLGAERALFRFFKTGRGAPKHGVIFKHPYIHGSPKWQRGKIARALATKISIAARIDFFSREDRGSELRKSLENRIEEIKAKYKEPTPRVKVKPRAMRRRR